MKNFEMGESLLQKITRIDCYVWAVIVLVLLIFFLVGMRDKVVESSVVYILPTTITVPEEVLEAVKNHNPEDNQPIVMKVPAEVQEAVKNYTLRTDSKPMFMGVIQLGRFTAMMIGLLIAAIFFIVGAIKKGKLRFRVSMSVETIPPPRDSEDSSTVLAQPEKPEDSQQVTSPTPSAETSGDQSEPGNHPAEHFSGGTTSANTPPTS